MFKTTHKSQKGIKREKHVIDASGRPLGRLSTEVARLLIGKHKVDYSPNADMGDFVTVENARNIKVTGRKAEQKKYYSHSGYPGGFKEASYAHLQEKHPGRVIEIAVKGMLPKNRLQKLRMGRLEIR